MIILLLLQLLLLFGTTTGFWPPFANFHSVISPRASSSRSSTTTTTTSVYDSETQTQQTALPFQIRAVERQDVEFISKLITKELSESGFNKEKKIPFWKMPAFLIEESAARIQIYERLEHW